MRQKADWTKQLLGGNCLTGREIDHIELLLRVSTCLCVVSLLSLGHGIG